MVSLKIYDTVLEQEVRGAWWGVATPEVLSDKDIVDAWLNAERDAYAPFMINPDDPYPGRQRTVNDRRMTGRTQSRGGGLLTDKQKFKLEATLNFENEEEFNKADNTTYNFSTLAVRNVHTAELLVWEGTATHSRRPAPEIFQKVQQCYGNRYERRTRVNRCLEDILNGVHVITIKPGLGGTGLGQGSLWTRGKWDGPGVYTVQEYDRWKDSGAAWLQSNKPTFDSLKDRWHEELTSRDPRVTICRKELRGCHEELERLRGPEVVVGPEDNVVSDDSTTARRAADSAPPSAVMPSAPPPEEYVAGREERFGEPLDAVMPSARPSADVAVPSAPPQGEYVAGREERFGRDSSATSPAPHPVEQALAEYPGLVHATEVGRAGSLFKHRKRKSFKKKSKKRKTAKKRKSSKKRKTSKR